MSERQRTSTTTSTESGFHLNRTHIFRAIASVVIATLLWGWITQVNDPIKKQELQNFNLQAPTLSDRLVVVTSLPQIRIDLEGPDSTIGDIRRSDLTARLDTSLVSGPGDYSLPVVVEGPEGSYEKKADPDKIAVRVEAIKSREIPLTIHKEFVNGDVSRIEDVIPDSSTVTITGPSSAVDRVDKVILPVSVNTDATQLRGSFEPYAVDKDNQRVTEVTILPANIQTTVELSQPGRSVSVIPDIVGTPAEGYSILQKAAIPETIVVDGPPEVIDTLLFVNTEPVDISGADSSVSQTVGIRNLPEGVRVISPSSGMVEVRVAISNNATQTHQVNGVGIQTMNVSSGFTASVEPTTIDVEVSGPDSEFSDMSASDVRAFVDLNDLKEGTHRVPVQVTVPAGITLVGTTPETVTVTISKSDDSTPQSTPVDSDALIWDRRLARLAS